MVPFALYRPAQCNDWDMACKQILVCPKQGKRKKAANPIVIVGQLLPPLAQPCGCPPGQPFSATTAAATTVEHLYPALSTLTVLVYNDLHV